MYSIEKDQKLPILKRIKGSLFDLAYKSGLMRLGRSLWPDSLTVINYHRIEDPGRPGFDSFLPNVSAHPDQFDQQLAYLRQWFHVISINELIDWLAGAGKLPSHAALITFDDGYLDNYIHAFPVLRRHQLPALIFLTTGHIGTDLPFYWDLAAYCFHHTLKESLRFPDGSEQQWRSSRHLESLSKDWVEDLKRLPESEKQTRVERLPEELGVSIPKGHFRELMLNWDMVREMKKSGISFGGHTISHPILTRIPLHEARREITGCKQRIEEELGEQVSSFAYPNGLKTDLDLPIRAVVEEAGFLFCVYPVEWPDHFDGGAAQAI